MKSYKHLLDDIEPIQYRLELQPDLANFTFVGQEEITFRLEKPCRELVFHADGLKISQVKLDDGVVASKTRYDKSTQTVIFEFTDDITAGEHKLRLEFTGELKDSLHGFYRSTYEHNGTTKHLATTQFEPTYAREAFICIDEPAAKAVFEVSLAIDKQLTAISNTNIVNETIDGQIKTCHFTPTPKMSTYLLAFMVGEFERITAKTRRGIEVGVCVTPGKLHQTEFALATGRDVLDFYEDYFGIPYPLPKLDMIAIPNFGSGAMENWGAVTYRETAILIDPEHSALATKQWAAMVIAHELAHQWFGNLVTMKWWTDLWLNEGFASWIEYLAIDHLFPQWQMWDQFVSNEYQSARQLDCLTNTHSIEVTVNNPGEINEIFDAISYQKGAAIIRMLHEFLGKDDFQRGLQNYLKKFSYSNAVTLDLWQTLEESSGKPVTKMMSTWTKQAGYPLVSIVREGKVNQRQFLTDPTRQPATTTVWPIPFQITTETGTRNLGIVEQSKTQLKIDQTAWIKPNSNQAGFFITNYSRELLADLTAPIKLQQLKSIDRMGIIADITLLNEAGLLAADVILEFLANLKAETSYIVWVEILQTLNNLLHITEDKKTYLQLKHYGRELLAEIKNKLGQTARPNEHYFDSLLRPIILSNLGKLGDKATIDYARNLLIKHEKGHPIEPNLRAFVYVTVACNGDANDYGRLEKLFSESDLQEEQRRLFAGLSAFEQPDLIKRSLELAMSPSVRSQDSLLYLRHMLANRYGRDQSWLFIQDNWSIFIKRYSGEHMLTHLVAGLGQAFITKEKAEQIRDFFADHMVAGIERSVAQAIERILIVDAWRQRDASPIENYLKRTSA